MTDLSLINVLACSEFGPDTARLSLTVREGLTISEILAEAMPTASADDLAQTRVALVNDRGSQIILPQHWHCVRPRASAHVVIRVIPAGGALKSILSIVVSVAAVALGTAFGAPLGAALFSGLTVNTATALGTALIGLGVSIVGNLLINALIPPTKPDTERRQSYAITGWKNRYEPGAAVPMVMGTMRYAPPMAATPYTEIVGDNQYVRALFCLGEGEVTINDMRLGETSLAEFDEVEIELRYGVEGELPVSLYPTQVVEEQIGVELTRPFPREDNGDITQVDEEYEARSWGIVEGGEWGWETVIRTRRVNAPGIETPVVRTTGPDASGASIILAWPGGLVRFNDDGGKLHHTVTVKVEQRPIEADEWQVVQTLNITAKKTEGFYRQHAWTFPQRGRWQVRVTMLTDETDDSKRAQRTTWVALQTIRPEYPLAFQRPLALVAMRIKATHQLTGALDNFNAVVSRVCSDWDAASGSWVRRVSDNPAAIYREVLTHAANPKPVSGAGMDLDLLSDWREWCATNGLTYNAVLDTAGTTLRDILTEVAAAGRATPRHDGIAWGVVIDRPMVNTMIVDHINPRNSWGFKWSRAYIDPPHAFTVKFQDAGNDYKETERVVRWPGYEGEITLTEQLPMPGKVYAAEIWREARRRQLETIYRPDSYEVSQDGAVRTATRGDAIALSHDVLSRVQIAARVKSVEGWLVELDELVEMQAGESYALRFRVFEDEDDNLGTSVVRTVRNYPGVGALLTLTGVGPAPQVGDLVHFGPASVESYTQIVTRIEATQDMCAIIRTVDAAPQIDIELAATAIPVWSSRVGAEIDDNLLQPSAPRFTSLTSGVNGTGVANRVAYAIAPGAGAIFTAGYQIEHRPNGAGSWTVVTIPAVNGGGNIDGYALGQIVQIRARGVSPTGVSGPYSVIVAITVGRDDAEIPQALDDAAISITTLLGGALIQFATGADAMTAAIQIYRSAGPDLDRETDAIGNLIPVRPFQSYSTALGDTTRANLIAGGGMGSAAPWTLGAGWSIAGGVAQHVAGAASAISQSFATTSGKFYRIGYAVSGRTAGTVQAFLSGGSARPGLIADANGRVRDRIQAVTGNNTFELRASTGFGGAVDDVAAYLETAACLSAGTHYVWIETQNADGVPGPIAGPYLVEII